MKYIPSSDEDHWFEQRQATHRPGQVVNQAGDVVIAGLAFVSASGARLPHLPRKPGVARSTFDPYVTIRLQG